MFQRTQRVRQIKLLEYLKKEKKALELWVDKEIKANDGLFIS